MESAFTTPVYSVSDAARILDLNASTLSTWVRGQSFHSASGVRSTRPLVTMDRGKKLLSFNDLVQAHLIRALTKDVGLPLQKVRRALDEAETITGSKNLSDLQLLTDRRDLFLDHLDDLVSLTPTRQLQLKEVSNEYLRRIEWADDRQPIRLRPVRQTSRRTDGIVVDPRVRFGRPVIEGTGVAVDTVIDRVDSGETISEISKDLELTERQIKKALRFYRFEA